MTWIYFFNEKQKKIHRTKKTSETFLNLEIEIFFFIIITSDASIIIWMNAKKILAGIDLFKLLHNAFLKYIRVEFPLYIII